MSEEQEAAGVGLPPFEWRVYADATCAGLACLVPLPLADRALEAIFRRRMPFTISKARGVGCEAERLRDLGKGEPWWPSPRGCLLAPLLFVPWLLKRLFKKILYFLTIREATRSLASFWYRAFLIDHLARSGRLDPAAPRGRVLVAFDETMAAVDAGGLRDLASAAVHEARFVFLSLLRARRQGATGAFTRQESILFHGWPAAVARLRVVAEQFERRMREGETTAPPVEQGPVPERTAPPAP